MTLDRGANCVLQGRMDTETANWRKFAKPNELIEHDGLIAADRANAARRRIIRNRCRMRGLPGPVFHGRNV